MAKKPRQERERQKERSRVRETRRGDRGNRRKRENSEGGRDEAHRGSFSVRIRNERNLVLRYHVSVTDPIFFSPRFDTRILARTHTMPTLLRAGARVLVSIRNISNSVLPLPTRFVTLHALSTFIPCVVFIPSLATRPNRTYLFRVSVASSRCASSSLGRRSSPNIVRVEIAKPQRATAASPSSSSVASSFSFSSSSSPSSAVARPPLPPFTSRSSMLDFN